MIWTISKGRAIGSLKEGCCHPPNSQVKKSSMGVHSPNTSSRSKMNVAKRPNNPDSAIRRALPTIRAARPLNFFLLANLTILPTKNRMTPIVMSKAPKAAGNMPIPKTNVISAVNVKGLSSSEPEGTSAVELAEGESVTLNLIVIFSTGGFIVTFYS